MAVCVLCSQRFFKVENEEKINIYFFHSMLPFFQSGYGTNMNRPTSTSVYQADLYRVNTRHSTTPCHSKKGQSSRHRLPVDVFPSPSADGTSCSCSDDVVSRPILCLLRSSQSTNFTHGYQWARKVRGESDCLP